MQHWWATALETVDLFDNQSLKFGTGDRDWKRFFILASSLFALREGTAPVKAVAHLTRNLIVEELQELFEVLNFPSLFIGWSVVVEKISGWDHGTAGLYLLHLDSNTLEIDVNRYTLQELDKANADYTALEQKHQGDRTHSVVLVAVESLKALRDAYPNYFADTDAFIDALLEEVYGQKIVPHYK